MFGNNNYFGNYNNAPYVPSAVSMPRTNKIYVTSFEEAMSKYAEPNSIMVYLHQNQPIFYEVTTDQYGRKTGTTYEYKIYAPVETKVDYATQDQLKELSEKIEEIQKRLEV